jgi:putative oxygen-independent coproporphyrinogen III oxidase
MDTIWRRPATGVDASPGAHRRPHPDPDRPEVRVAEPADRGALDRAAAHGAHPEAGGPGFGVYVHVPFCSRRCDYCAFATWTDRSHLMGAYARAAALEVRQAVAGGMPPATSVFFGGGTPSLLPVADLGRILAAVPTEPGAEVTVECNPDTVDADRLRAYRDLGVTRLSFGVQSMVPAVLRSLGRTHDVAAVQHSVRAAGEAGFAGAFSLDLIYGAVGETLDDWRRSLVEVLALDPAHLSVYGLTPEPGTPLGMDPSRHPDGDDQADKYELADELLSAAGLEWYELSNWARPGAESRHNRLYWRQGPYRGIGCAAHSHAVDADGGARRWWNVRTPERYIGLMESGGAVEAAGEDLDPGARRTEAWHLGLRTREGVLRSELADDVELQAVRDAGLVEEVTGSGGPRLVLTRRGRLLANEVAVRLAP